MLGTNRIQNRQHASTLPATRSCGFGQNPAESISVCPRVRYHCASIPSFPQRPSEFTNVIRNCFATVTSQTLIACFFALVATAEGGTVDPQQSDWYKKYKSQENAPKPAEMLLNTDDEPELTEGFTSLFNGQDLSGWTPKGGQCEFEAKDGMLIGTCVPDSPSTYLSTDRNDFSDFIFTCDMKWEVNGNSGVMFRAKSEMRKGAETVFGPQAEMEGIRGDRFWNGGIYGQSCGGYFYPVWLTAHKEARAALDPTGWNRLTISAKGNVVKTWVNGVPVAHWIDNGSYPRGFFGLQIHKGQEGKVVWKNIRVKEL